MNELILKILEKSYRNKYTKNIKEFNYSLEEYVKLENVNNQDIDILLNKKIYNNYMVYLDNLLDSNLNLSASDSIENADYFKQCQIKYCLMQIIEQKPTPINYIVEKLKEINYLFNNTDYEINIDKQQLNNVFGDGQSIFYFENICSSLNFLKDIYSIEKIKNIIINNNLQTNFLTCLINEIVTQQVEDVPEIKIFIQNTINVFEDQQLFLNLLDKELKTLDETDIFYNYLNEIKVWLEKQMLEKEISFKNNKKNNAILNKI